MIAAVFDTNVLISGALSPHGSPGRLVDALVEGVVQAVVDDRIWDEYEEVFRRPFFSFPACDVDAFLAVLRARAVYAPLVPGRTHSQKLPDPDDAPFLECAAALGVPLVTGNPRHYPKSAARDVEVLSPAAYWARLTGG